MENDRIEIHPACDRWMRGDRYGSVIEIRTRKKRGTEYKVHLDKSGRIAWFSAALIHRWL